MTEMEPSECPVDEEEDVSYFTSYEDIEIHKLMLQDVPRTEAYKKAILGNEKFFKDKTVMDVGAGTGILSLFCAQAGARKVYAVEASKMAFVVQQVVEKNGFSHIIEVIHGKAEDIDLPDGVQVDIIVSEWMGFYLLHESMLDSVIAARDKHLKADGVMLPSSAKLYASACRLPQFFSQQTHFWKSVYGFDMSNVSEQILASKRNKPEITLVNKDDILCDPVCIMDIDLAWVGVDEIDTIRSRIFTSIQCQEPEIYQCVALWFDCVFQVPGEGDAIVLSTSPHAEATHWKQTVVVFPSAISVEDGDLIGWQLQLSQSSENRRHYVIELSLLDPEVEEHPVPCSCGQTKCVIISAYLAKEDLLLEPGAEIIDIS